MASISAPPAVTSQQSSSLSISAQVGIAILTLAFVLGFPGTCLCLVRGLPGEEASVTCLLVLNLALADASVLLSAPLFLRYLAGGRAGSLAQRRASWCTTCRVSTCYVSIYLICLMSMDRWLAVTKPFLSQRMRTKRSLLVLLLGVWVMAFLLSLPMPFYRRWDANLLCTSPSVWQCYVFKACRRANERWMKWPHFTRKDILLLLNLADGLQLFGVNTNIKSDGLWDRVLLVHVGLFPSTVIGSSNSQTTPPSTFVCRTTGTACVHKVFQYTFETVMACLVPFSLINTCYASVICRLRSATFHHRGRGSRLILIIVCAFAAFWLPYHIVNIIEVTSFGICWKPEASLFGQIL